jgi:leader peptidase (prepilin peptidase)/N-methyltransferase
VLQARTVEMVDRCYGRCALRLTPVDLKVGPDRFDPAQVPYLSVVTDALVVPREAMGLGDVKFMAAIGAFLGWKAVLFSLMASSMLGALVGVTLVLIGRREWSSRLPYGPYIAVAATLWIFGGKEVFTAWLAR